MARNITHDLRVLNAEQSGDDLVIDLYGGPSNACGSVRFTFTSDEELEARLALVRSWCDDQRSVALVTDDSQIVLIDERRLSEQSEKPEPSEA
jgi:cell wall assembly regulator SMI1